MICGFVFLCLSASTLAGFDLDRTGEFPPDQIDHIDGDRANNRWANLRPASNAQNARNRTTARGYTIHKPSGKYVAQIMRGGRNICLGYYSTAEEAARAYRAAANSF